ncbi:hypothetical protein MUN88_06395 [Gracilibacillus caseinilyticus]|uniref:Uncharacterized protein n=1 Tax=Gracilibacillus caseinilyticus TaxID=2932256 RepID=A0ABY4EZ84_9BACI|nr:hypothetical protein [Gracilibacillus caseinilyticus]UOQ49704.1 hypothetical protein MUN88_06395 [Gracilibacillus caseinilyticus]
MDDTIRKVDSNQMASSLGTFVERMPVEDRISSTVEILKRRADIADYRKEQKKNDQRKSVRKEPNIYKTMKKERRKALYQNIYR